MEKFILEIIERKIAESIESGKEIYKKYFVNTKIYEKYKPNIDQHLKDDGYCEIIDESTEVVDEPMQEPLSVDDVEMVDNPVLEVEE